MFAHRFMSPQALEMKISFFVVQIYNYEIIHSTVKNMTCRVKFDYTSAALGIDSHVFKRVSINYAFLFIYQTAPWQLY